MTGERDLRPFFNMSGEQLNQLANAAAKEGNPCFISLCALEARRRTRSPRVVEHIEEIAAKHSLPIIPWIEVAAAEAKRFQKVTNGPRNLYVVLLERISDAGNELGLYVGQTGILVEERFSQHRSGYKASKHVKRHGVCLLPTLYVHLREMGRGEADEMEAELAEAFAESDIWTEGGH